MTIHLDDAQELGTLDELLEEAGFEIPSNLEDDVIIQPDYVMFAAPFVRIKSKIANLKSEIYRGGY